MSREIVSLRNVWVKYGKEYVLEEVDLTLREHEYLAVIGPNGSGKTTLLKVILGLVRPVRGDVALFGTSPSGGRERVGYLPQYSTIDRGFPITVFEAVLTGRQRGVVQRPGREDRAKVEQALEMLGIGRLADRRVGTLSGGELQRVFLARALAREPELLLLDEPLTSIDPEVQHSFYGILDDLKERMSIVLVSHDVGVVLSHVDTVACLNRRLCYHGPPEGAPEVLEEVYRCPIELIGHGVPHRVLKEH